MNITFGNRAVSLLTKNTALNCYSFALPAGNSCPGTVAKTEDDICSGCYAKLNLNNLSNVSSAQWTRFNWLRHNLRTEKGRQEVRLKLYLAIASKVDNGYFRIHCSGDFFNAQYTKIWQYVCEKLPHINFWAPTRSHRVQSILPELIKLNSLPNVFVRPSAIKFDEKPPKIKGLSKGTGVITDIHNSEYVCPKTVNHNTCTDNGCRTCWSNDKNINYLVHGFTGRTSKDIVTPKIVQLRINVARNFNAELSKVASSIR